MEQWLELAKGPLFQFALLFMLLGMLRHMVSAALGVVQAMKRASNKTIPYRDVLKATGKWLAPVDRVKTSPLFSITSILMHVGLIVVPVFLFSHVALWERGIGLSLPALSLGPADFLTLLTLACIFTLLAIRIISRDGRALSRFEDYFLLILLAIPFISGYLALHPHLNPFAYDPTMLVHVLSADLVLFLVPLTKLSHMALMPGVQLFAEVAWHFPKDSGKNVEIALNKEDKPI